MQAENIPKMAAAVAAVKGTQTDSCCSRSQQTTPGTNETAKASNCVHRRNMLSLVLLIIFGKIRSHNWNAKDIDL